MDWFVGDNFHRKVPQHFMGKTPWFPVKIFPENPRFFVDFYRNPLVLSMLNGYINTTNHHYDYGLIPWIPFSWVLLVITMVPTTG